MVGNGGTHPVGRIAAVLALLAVVLGSGCNYGMLQPAHTLGEGRYVFRSGLMLPAFLDPDDREQAEETREDYLEVYGKGYFSIGATDRIDLGFSFLAYGLGPHFRIGALPPEDPLALTGMLDVIYVTPVKVISPRLTLSAGRRLGSRFEIYGGYQVGYGPDLANLPLEEPEGEGTDWDAVENATFHGLVAGCYYEIKTGEESDFGWLVPEAIAIEFAVPLGFERPLIITGLAVTY